MKRKLMLGFLLLLMNGYVLAEDGQGYRIINEKFISTPNAKGYLVSQSSNEKLTKEGDIKSYAFAQNQVGCPSTFNTVQGFHEVTIRNSTDKMQQFSYIYSMSVEDAKNYFERNIELDPKGYYHDASLDYLTFQRPGVEKRYDILVDTTISGDGKDSNSHTGYLNLWFRLCK